MKRRLAGVVNQALKSKGRQIGRLMLAFREGEKTLPELTQAAGVESAEAGTLVQLLMELDFIGK